MAQNFEAGLLRVLTAGGVTMGAGFLIGDRLVLTCAHVVCKAGYMPDQSIQLKFHHNDQSVQATVLPKFWRDTEKEDLAVLRLELETLPEGVTPLQLNVYLPDSSRDFQTLGYPDIPGVDFLRGEGNIIGKTSIKTGIKVLQLGSEQVTAGFSGAPVIEAATGFVLGMISDITLPDKYLRQGITAFATSSEVLAEICKPLGIDITTPYCPYPGMVPFSEAESDRFFGRKNEINHMLKHFRKQRVLFVIGSSGSGKSSLIAAGFLPKLRESHLYAPKYWIVREMTPKNRPLQSLENVFGSGLSQVQESVTHFLAEHPPAVKLLLVIDQFEELFTQNESQVQREFLLFIRSLQELENCAVLAAMRSDFYGDLIDSSEQLQVNPSQRLELSVLIGNPLRKAITQPALDLGVHLDTLLVERLVNDATNGPGPLPLLQETLRLLWDKEYFIGRILPLDAYQKLGGKFRSGLEVAIETHANAVYDNLDRPQQVIARRIFLRLVQFGEGGRADTRRQQPVAALRATGDDSNIFEDTLQHLIDHRLVTASGEERAEERKMDMAHEALITGWPKLQTWIKESRSTEIKRRQFNLKVYEWERLGGGVGGLLDVVELSEAQTWLNDPDAPKLNERDWKYLLVSAIFLGCDIVPWLKPSREKAVSWMREILFVQSHPLILRKAAARNLGLLSDTTTFNQLSSNANEAEEKSQKQSARELLAEYMYHAPDPVKLPGILRLALLPHSARLSFGEGKEERKRMRLIAALTVIPLYLLNQWSMGLSGNVFAVVFAAFLAVIAAGLYVEVVVFLTFFLRRWAPIWSALILLVAGSLVGWLLFALIAIPQHYILGGFLAIAVMHGTGRMKTSKPFHPWLYIALLGIMSYLWLVIIGDNDIALFALPTGVFSGIYAYFSFQMQSGNPGREKK